MTRGNNREAWVATGGAGVVGEASERKGHKEPWLVKTNKNKKIKKGLEISISTAPPPPRSTVGHKQQENYYFLLPGQSRSASPSTRFHPKG